MENKKVTDTEPSSDRDISTLDSRPFAIMELSLDSNQTSEEKSVEKETILCNVATDSLDFLATIATESNKLENEASSNEPKANAPSITEDRADARNSSTKSTTTGGEELSMLSLNEITDQVRSSMNTNKDLTQTDNLAKTTRKRILSKQQQETSSRPKQRQTKKCPPQTTAVDTDSMNANKDLPQSDNLVKTTRNRILPKQQPERSTRPKQRKTEKCLPKATAVDDDWSMEEKGLLLEALEEDRGCAYWTNIAKKIKTKNVDQVKHYTEILRAQATDSVPIHLGEVDSPLQAWITACERLIYGQDDIDAQCIPQVMTIAAVEPEPMSSLPDNFWVPSYSRIYTFLSGVLRGLPCLRLSPVEAKVVLELVQNLEMKLHSIDFPEQVQFLRTKYNTIRKELEQEQVTFATEELQQEVIRGECNRSNYQSHGRHHKNTEKSNSNQTMSTTPANTALNPSCSTKRRRCRRAKLYDKGPQLSSLNPVNVPVSLLGLGITKANN